MVKKRVDYCAVLFVFLINLILLSNIISAQATGGAVDDQISNTVDKVEKASEQVSEVSRGDYLASEWKTILMNDTAIQSIDSSLTKSNSIFLTLFGQNYLLISNIWFVILLWILTATLTSDVLKARFKLNRLGGLCIGIVVAIIFAQAKILTSIASILSRVIGALGNPWIRLLAWIIVIVGVFFISKLVQSLKKSLEKKRKKEAEEKTEFRQKKIEKFTEGAGI